VNNFHGFQGGFSQADSSAKKANIPKIIVESEQWSEEDAK
jgi:hypothetical protein